MKNVLVINMDDLSTDEWRALSLTLTEPFGHWVTFPSYVLNTSVCGPSRATLLSGQYAHHTGVYINPDFTGMDVSNLLPVWVTADGVTKAGIFGKYGNGFPRVAPDPQAAQEWFPPGWTDGRIYVYSQNYLDFTLRSKAELSPGLYQQTYPHDTAVGVPPASNGELNYSTDVVTWYANQFITNHVADPWFLYVAYVSPHRDLRTGTETDNYPVPATRHAGLCSGLKPIRATNNPSLYQYDPSWNNVSGKPAWMQSAYAPGSPTRNLNAGTGTTLRAALDTERIKAWESLKAVDDGIISILHTLSALGQLDQTCVILTSDNGFAHGQHRHNGKLTPYEHSAASKAMVRHPAATARVEQQVIGNVDIAATVMQLLGKTPPPMDGQSFAGCLDPAFPLPTRAEHLIEQRTPGGSDVPDTAALAAAGYGSLTTVPTYWGIRGLLWKYIEWDSGEKELYDLWTDAYELKNVINDPTHADLRATAEALLPQMKASQPV